MCSITVTLTTVTLLDRSNPRTDRAAWGGVAGSVLGATRGLARFLDLKSCVIFFLHMPFSFRDRAELPFQPLYPDALGLPKWPYGPKARTTRRRRGEKAKPHRWHRAAVPRLASAGKMTADVQMKDTEPQPAASPPAAVSALHRKLPPLSATLVCIPRIRRG
jgi:hypothetical protein